MEDTCRMLLQPSLASHRPNRLRKANASFASASAPGVAAVRGAPSDPFDPLENVCYRQRALLQVTFNLPPDPLQTPPDPLLTPPHTQHAHTHTHTHAWSLLLGILGVHN
eukprot:9479067-Pyramimonas_sp.AAC.2